MWSINGSDIFVDYHCNDELFINSYFVIENVSQFHVLSPPKCNPNLFGQIFILTLTNMIFLLIRVLHLILLCILLLLMLFLLHLILFFVLLLSMCLTHLIPFFVLTYVIVSYASYSVFSPTSMTMCFAYDSIFCPIFVCVSCPCDYQLTIT